MSYNSRYLNTKAIRSNEAAEEITSSKKKKYSLGQVFPSYMPLLNLMLPSFQQSWREGVNFYQDTLTTITPNTFQVDWLVINYGHVYELQTVNDC